MKRFRPAVALSLFVIASISGSCKNEPSASEEVEVSIVPAPETDPTFTRDIAPLIFSHCSGCHRPGEAAPFSLLSYQDVAKRGRQILDVTESKYMPPWLPEAQTHKFADARRLSEPEFQTLTNWVKNGMPEGAPEDLPPLPEWPEGWQLGQPDHIIELSTDYLLPAEGGDVFRSFVLPPGLNEPRFVRSVEIRPDNPRIIHHGVILKDPTQEGRRLDQLDPEPGYPRMQQSHLITSPDGQFIGWTPGKIPKEGPEDMAWKLEPGTDLIAALHMLPTGKPEPVKLRIGLYFAEKPPARKPAMIQMEIQTIDIPANQPIYEISDTFVLPVDTKLLRIYPHAHYLARELSVIATEPRGKKRVLLHIQDWDFNRQDDYQYFEPLFLPEGTEIQMLYTYDNSESNERNPHSPPRRVTYGELSTDEMGSLWIQALPRKATDLEKLEQAIAEKSAEQAKEGFRFTLRKNPDDPEAANNLAAILSIEGKRREAQKLFNHALSIAPDHRPTLFNLGLMHFKSGEIASAKKHFEKVINLDPSHAAALSQLGTIAAAENDFVTAIDLFQRALASKPDHETCYNIGVSYLAMEQPREAIPFLIKATTLNAAEPLTQLNLGVCYFNIGDWENAEEHFRETIRLAPDFVPGFLNLGNSLIKQGQISQAITQFERAVQIDPRSPQARQSLHASQRLLQNR